MRSRWTRLVAAATISLVAGATLAGGSLAQDEVDAEHPIVGTWLVVPADEVPPGSAELFVVGADGSVSELTEAGSGAGSWLPEGESGAIVTVLFPQTDRQGAFVGVRTVRGSLEVGADGDSFDGLVTSELSAGADGSTGQLAPRAVSGTRVIAEAPEIPTGTPGEAVVEPLVPQPRNTTDCAGRPVLIERSLSEFRLTGDCPEVTVTGTSIDVYAQDIGVLEVRGTGNDVNAREVSSALLSGRGNDLVARSVGKLTITGNSNDADVRGPIDEVIIDGSRNDVRGRPVGSVVSNGRFNDIERR